MIFKEEELASSILVPPLEKNTILICLMKKNEVVFQVLIDSTTKEIWIDRHEDLTDMFEGYEVKDGQIGF